MMEKLIGRKNQWKYAFFAALGLLLLLHCAPKSEYEKMRQRELARGVRVDSLFLGMHFGMTAEEFYTHCWELNKQGLIRQGPKNQSVEYQLEELRFPAKMNFYPNFSPDRKIYEMPVAISYTAWAPWNKSLQGDSLQLDVVNMLERWYGGSFLKVENPKKGVVYVKIDGNRQIRVLNDDFQVKVFFTDLTYKKQ